MSMKFSIELISDLVPNLEPGNKACMGLIRIGSFEEHFIASLTYWRADDYERHWKDAIFRIVKGHLTSCLITSMIDPENAKFIFWWPMYRVQDTVFIQNQILFFENLPHTFNENDPFSSIPERVTVNDEGQRLSEWTIPVKSLEEFLQDKEGKLIT